MKLLPEGKSRALSGLALAAAAAFGLGSIQAVRDLLTVLGVFSTSTFLLELAHARVPMNMPPLARFIIYNMRLFFIFSVFFWLSGFTLALGVWARREWARRGATGMLYLLSAAALLLVFFPSLAVPRQLVRDGVSLAPEFNAAVKTASFVTRVGALLAGSLSMWWALALDRGALKNEFH